MRQFYLVWPWLILLIPWRRIPIIFAVTVGIGIASRWVIAWRGDPYPVDYVFPLSSLDFFAVGGILAWMKKTQPKQWQWVFQKGIWIAVPLAIILGLGSYLHWRPIGWQVTRIFLVAIVWGVVVAQAADGKNIAVGRILGWRPLMWMGQISYGLYLFHPWAQIGINRICRWSGWEGWYDLNPYLRFPVTMALTVVVAAGSYYLFEKPFLRLKNRWR